MVNGGYSNSSLVRSPIIEKLVTTYNHCMTNELLWFNMTIISPLYNQAHGYRATKSCYTDQSDSERCGDPWWSMGDWSQWSARCVYKRYHVSRVSIHHNINHNHVVNHINSSESAILIMIHRISRVSPLMTHPWWILQWWFNWNVGSRRPNSSCHNMLVAVAEALCWRHLSND